MKLCSLGGERVLEEEEEGEKREEEEEGEEEDSRINYGPRIHGS